MKVRSFCEIELENGLREKYSSSVESQKMRRESALTLSRLLGLRPLLCRWWNQCCRVDPAFCSGQRMIRFQWSLSIRWSGTVQCWFLHHSGRSYCYLRLCQMSRPCRQRSLTSRRNLSNYYRRVPSLQRSPSPCRLCRIGLGCVIVCCVCRVLPKIRSSARTCCSGILVFPFFSSDA
jgi:hypothetical protein